jgi:predicted Zn finger-like uncharacterized protein
MYTQCPACLTVFSLDVGTLTLAGGQVSCGHCGDTFDALANLADQLPPEPFRELPLHPDLMRPPLLELAVYRPPAEPVAVVAADTSGSAGADASGPQAFAPRFARNRRESTERFWPWVFACTFLTLLLGSQLAWAKRDFLIRDPQSGPLLQQICNTLHCQLPLVAAPGQLRLLASNVQTHPSVRGALVISLGVRNDAPFSQPYPVVALTLSDAQGKRVAMRRLQPAEYLDDPQAVQRGLAPGSRTALLFEVEDPGTRAVAFAFDFE